MLAEPCCSRGQPPPTLSQALTRPGISQAALGMQEPAPDGGIQLLWLGNKYCGSEQCEPGRAAQE